MIYFKNPYKITIIQLNLDIVIVKFQDFHETQYDSKYTSRCLKLWNYHCKNDLLFDSEISINISPFPLNWNILTFCEYKIK